MARRIRLFLIRHGETVDNVAGLCAGSRDSELTNHGYQQATRLGFHFRSLGVQFTHIFSSHLKRAVKTASKIREGQLNSIRKGGDGSVVPDVVQLPVLMEQDFGSMEGKKWSDRPAIMKATGRGHGGQANKDSESFVDAESKASMAKRADAFLDKCIVPLLSDGSEIIDPVVAIVSHGLLLSTLWKRLLLRLPTKSVSLSAEIQSTAPPPSLEHLGSWSNTGYLELNMVKTEHKGFTSKEYESLAETPVARSSDDSLPQAGESVIREGRAEEPALEAAVADAINASPLLKKEKASAPAIPSRPKMPAKSIEGWSTTVLSINGKGHLKGFKRTGGGLGSSRHDASQQSIEVFFKRQKTV